MSAAIIAAVTAVVGTGYSIYAGEEAKRAAEDAKKKAEEKRIAEEKRLEQIAKDTRPEGEKATVEYGVDKTTKAGDYTDFLIKKQSSNTLGSSKDSGLGGTGSSGLGMV